MTSLIKCDTSLNRCKWCTGGCRSFSTQVFKWVDSFVWRGRKCAAGPERCRPLIGLWFSFALGTWTRAEDSCFDAFSQKNPTSIAEYAIHLDKHIKLYAETVDSFRFLATSGIICLSGVCLRQTQYMGALFNLVKRSNITRRRRPKNSAKTLELVNKYKIYWGVILKKPMEKFWLTCREFLEFSPQRTVDDDDSASMGPTKKQIIWAALFNLIKAPDRPSEAKKENQNLEACGKI